MKNSVAILSLCVIAFAMIIILCGGVQGFNDDRGILKWNPYWFADGRNSAPVSYYGATGRGGLPKRLGERSSKFDSQIYKWSPVYFSNYGSLVRSMGAGRFNSKNKFIDEHFSSGLDLK